MIKKYLTTLTLILVFLVAQADTLVLKVVYDGTIDYNNSTSLTIKTLEAANKGDKVEILLNSPGGSVDAGYDMVEAMDDSDAYVVVVVENYAASMAANMLCEAPHYKVSRNAILMWHMAFYLDDDGKKVPLDLKDPTDKAIYDRANKTMRKCGFLTDAEIRKVDAGGEVWLTGAEINARLKNMGRV